MAPANKLHFRLYYHNIADFLCLDIKRAITRLYLLLNIPWLSCKIILAFHSIRSL